MTDDKVYYNFIGKQINIIREIYKLPNGKIYLKVDTTHGTQLHIQLDFSNTDKLSDECTRMISKILKEQED